MRTEKQINDEIEFVRNNFRSLNPGRKLESGSKDGKHIAFLHQCAAYVSSTSTLSDDILNRQLSDLTRRMKAANDGMNKYLSENEYASKSKVRGMFEKEFGLKQMRLQIKTIKYLLS